MSVPLRASRVSLSDETRWALADLFNSLLADAIDVWSRLKHAHWNVRGPQFAMLHDLFDRLASETEEAADLLAERAAQLGALARGTVREVSLATTISISSDPPSPDKSPTNNLAEVVASFADHLRVAIGRAEQLSEPVSADILTEIARAAEKSLWLLEAHRE